MKAAIIRDYGGPEMVSVGDIPEPQVNPGQVLVGIRSASLNHLDIWVRNGNRFDLSMPHVLGSDGAGVIEAVVEGVTGVNVGDEVLISPGLGCGRCEFCQQGQLSLCESFGIVGASCPGTFAERVAVPAGNVVAKPPELSFSEAAALPVAYVTAWRMLMTRAELTPGETVLIHGIGGGVALAALQLAKLVSAEVIVTSSSDEKLAKAVDLGADHTINYAKTADLTKSVRDLTKGRGVDLAVDAVGAATWSVNLYALRRGGRAVHCGITTGAMADADIQAIYWNQLTIMGSTYGSMDDLRQLLRTVTVSGLRPVIDSTWSLEDFPKAQQRMEAGLQFGKIVLEV